MELIKSKEVDAQFVETSTFLATSHVYKGLQSPNNSFCNPQNFITTEGARHEREVVGGRGVEKDATGGGGAEEETPTVAKEESPRQVIVVVAEAFGPLIGPKKTFTNHIMKHVFYANWHFARLPFRIEHILYMFYANDCTNDRVNSPMINF